MFSLDSIRIVRKNWVSPKRKLVHSSLTKGSSYLNWLVLIYPARDNIPVMLQNSSRETYHLLKPFTQNY